METIIAHPWFAGFDFDSLMNKELEPPYVPDLPEDIEVLIGFDPDMKNLSLFEEDSPEQDRKKVREFKDAFKEFDL
jgi:hypothetical protein